MSDERTGMNIETWREGMTDKETADIGYWERNMLALYLADGWYQDLESNYPGWKRVLSLFNGQACFHIPDDFDVLNLPEILPNWDGHTTVLKWERLVDTIRVKRTSLKPPFSDHKTQEGCALNTPLKRSE